MNELIKINPRQIGERMVNSVNARDLHAALEAGQFFANWIKLQIERANLVEDSDYVVFANPSKNSEGRPPKEYALKMEAAKHIAMMSQTAKGSQVRDYFIECERLALAPVLDPAKLTKMQILQMALDSESERLALKSEVEELKPQAAALERIAQADGTMCITNAAKALQIQPKRLFAWLREHGWIYRRPGGSGWVAYQDRIMLGYLEHKVTTVARGDGSEKVCEQVLVTAKGLTCLARTLPRTELFSAPAVHEGNGRLNGSFLFD